MPWLPHLPHLAHFAKLANPLLTWPVSLLPTEHGLNSRPCIYGSYSSPGWLLQLLLLLTCRSTLTAGNLAALWRGGANGRWKSLRGKCDLLFPKVASENCSKQFDRQVMGKWFPKSSIDWISSKRRQILQMHLKVKSFSGSIFHAAWNATFQWQRAVFNPLWEKVGFYSERGQKTKAKRGMQLKCNLWSGLWQTYMHIYAYPAEYLAQKRDKKQKRKLRKIQMGKKGKTLNSLVELSCAPL